MSVANPGIPPVLEVLPDRKEHLRRIVGAINEVMSGRIRSTLDVTLTANQSSTTVVDSRIGYYSAIRWTPMTQSAAMESTSGNMYVPQATLLKGSAVIQHSNLTTTDRTFRLFIVSP